MSLKTIENTRNNKIFKLWDILLYLLVAVAIGAMFVALVVKNESSGDVKGVQISYQKQIVATYTFDDDKFTQTGGSGIAFETKKEDGNFIVTILTEEGKGKNIMVVDTATYKVTMKDANCSSDRDCTYMSIKKPTDSIVCIPHDLVITAILQGFTEPGDIIV